MTQLRVLTRSGLGLPTIGPFALKLLAWFRAGENLHHEQVVEGPRKGPKGKNRWIELYGQRIGDSEVIIDLLARPPRPFPLI